MELEPRVPSGSAAEKVTVMGTPVLAGVGLTLATDTTGGLSVIVTEPRPGAVEPLLSVAVTAMVKVWDNTFPVLAYLWMSEVAVAGRMSGGDPSPQLTLNEAIVPSGSLAVKVTVMTVPVVAVAGLVLVTEITGGLSLMVTEPESEPVKPTLSVPVTVTVNIVLAMEPVEV